MTDPRAAAPDPGAAARVIDPSLPPSHPGPRTARLPRTLADAIVAHARAMVPEEACGLIAGSDTAARGGEALRYAACRNAAASPARYVVDPDDLYRVVDAIDRADEALWGIVHSHPATAAVPSPLDVERATWPDALYLVVSLAATPVLRAWRIVDGRVHEVALETAG